MSAVCIPVRITPLDDHEYFSLRIPLPSRVFVGQVGGKLRFYTTNRLRRIPLMYSDVTELYSHESFLHGSSRTAYLRIRNSKVEAMYVFTREAHGLFLDDAMRTALLGDTYGEHI